MKDPMELLDKHFDGLLDEAEAAELCRWVKEGPGNAELVTRAAMIHQRLRQVMRGRQLLEEAASLGHSLDDAVIMPAITLEPEAEAGEETSLQHQIPSPQIPPASSSRFKYWRLAAAIALPILIGAALWAVLRPANPTAAFVASAGAVWEDAAHAPRAGQRLSVEPLHLSSGLAQIRLDNGVSLIFEGPATFQMKSQTAVTLSLGKLTVSVPPNAHGFTVETPAARTVDLGTEFGVLVDNAGNTETHVIRGTVEITPVVGGATARLTADDAARVAYGASAAQRIAALTGNFVQDVPAIDLVDVIAGGDGTQRRADSGIDIANGNVMPRPVDRRALQKAATEDVTGDGRFHPCPERPLVGGVFIPHGGSTPDTLDPAGHQFNFPATSNHSYLGVWPFDISNAAGGWEARSDVVGSIDYSAPGHRLLVMHANKAVTFDLDALRTAHPDRPFGHLQGVCVNLNSTVAAHGSKMSDRSEFWVFVDGDLRSHRLIHRTDPPFDVDVPIEPSAHYLTIASTDGGDGFNWDLVSLGDPRLK